MNNLRSAAILGILLLAACSDDDERRNTRLVVDNRSAEPVLVYVKSGDPMGVKFDLDFTLEAASAVEYKLLEADWVEVKVLRSSDLQQIFLDSWTHAELDHLDDRVTVTLEP